MADFEIAFSRTMKAEGGYKLTNHPKDTGGMTYAGIARKFHQNWGGWLFIDRNETPPTDLVRGFYREQFWEVVRGDSIIAQDIANNIYDFAVNTGTKPAMKMAQVVAGVEADGVFGAKTLMAINGLDPAGFKLAYALAKITRYRNIVQANPSQKVFLLGWINRVLEQAA
jgi:lysozyme family protein